MKIIAKVKDYYDHCVGKYGVDPKLVYDRRDGQSIDIERDCNEGDLVHVHIAGTVFPMIFLDGKFRGDIDSFTARQTAIDNKSRQTNFRWHQGSDSNLIQHWRSWHADNTDKNAERREPVLVEDKGGTMYHTFGYNNKGRIFKPLLLSQYNFASVMSPETAWISISNFLGWCVDNPPLPNNQTNKEKILSHGFDLKKSFRHRK